MNLGSVPSGYSGNTFLNASTNPGAPAGTQGWSRDGRRFRLVKAGAGLLAGRLVQGPGPITGHLGLTPTADVPIGANQIRLTAGPGAGTDAPANTYAGGALYVSAGGVGPSYAIRSHQPIVAAQPFTVTLESDDPIWTPLVALSDRIDLMPNPYSGVVMVPGTAATSGAVGVPMFNIDAGNWGFVQVEGLCPVIADGAIAVGQAVAPSILAIGAVGPISGTLPMIGSTVQAVPVSGRIFSISLNLP